MEEVQREEKACKSCTPFTKLDIPNIWKKENYKKQNTCLYVSEICTEGFL